MSPTLHCYRCGQTLEALTLPISRRDECPQCRVEMHVCRMCVYYAPRLPDACAEDDALEVKEKSRPNFCDYYKPSADAYSPGELEAEVAAHRDLGALFDGETAADSARGEDTPVSTGDTDDSAGDAEALFK